MYDLESTTVAGVAEHKLCCSCGACMWVCPHEAISFEETVGGYLFPRINSGLCTACGLCRSVCPGTGLVPNVARALPADPFVGTAVGTYVGKAADEQLSSSSQSGGIVSSLLAHSLAVGEIEAAVVTTMASGKPPRPMPMLARNVEEVRLAQKSKYCPVPLLSVLRSLDEFKGPVALVGLPCHIHGLLNVIDRIPRMRQRISFTVGLICDRVLTYGAVDYLVRQSRLPLDKPQVLCFRDKACGGYPGNVSVTDSDGHLVVMPASMRIRTKEFFTPACCRLCFDKLNVFADVAVGDPWGINGVDGVKGESVAVLRTEVGARIFREAVNRGALSCREIDYVHVATGQHVERKRSDWRAYTRAWEELGRAIPDFGISVGRRLAKGHRKGLYSRHIQHAIELDLYPSREALLDAAEKHFFIRSLRRVIAGPIRALMRTCRVLTK